MAKRYRFWLFLIFLHTIPLRLLCHQKTLRKIVRTQSKMVQRPFSEGSSIDTVPWSNSSQMHPIDGAEAIIIPGFSQAKTVFHKQQRPKIPTTILSSADSTKSKSSYSRIKSAKKESIDPFEFRLPKNTFTNLTKLLQDKNGESLVFYPKGSNNSGVPTELTIANYYEIPNVPASSKFFPSSDDVQKRESNLNVKGNTLDKPNYENVKNNSQLVLGRYGANNNVNRYHNPVNQIAKIDFNNAESDIGGDNEKVDFLIEEVVADENINNSLHENPYSCAVLNEFNADIDAQVKFFDLDIEPTWTTKKQYWNNIYDSRYESLMRNPKWPSLNVILIPCSHVDSIWKKTFEHYHNNTVAKIISNIVKKLQFYKNFTFTWNEVSHLSNWWKKTSHKNRIAIRKLLKSGRLEITTGGWVESDEATSHLYGLVHQLIEGHQWLKQNLNYEPKVGWLTNSVTHSPTLPYLFSVAGITQFVMTNIHHAWEQYFAEFQYSDFIWQQAWDDIKNGDTNLNQVLNKIGYDRYPKNSVLTHYMQFNSDSFRACGPNKHICITDFDFNKNNKNIDINMFNVKQKAEMLLEQYSKTGTISSHNVIIAPVGGRYRYEYQTEFDYQYNNYQKLLDFININTDIYKATVQFGTPKDYFNIITEKIKSYPTLKGDFPNFSDIKSGVPAYWSGFFTNRPWLKILLRKLQSTLRSTEILLSFAVNFNVLPHVNSTELLELLIKTRETVARLQDRHVVGGTLGITTLQYVYKNILTAAKDCWFIQEIVASLLTMKPLSKVPYLQKFVFREGELLSPTFKAVSPGDQFYVFNSLGQERTEIVELTTNKPNLRILDHNQKEVTVQINPVWTYTSDDVIKISTKYYKIIFAVVVPAMTLELYKIKETFDTSHNSATIYCSNCVLDIEDEKPSFMFNLQPLKVGDIQLESYKHRVIIDELTGFLKKVIEKETNREKSVVINYGAFKSAHTNAGMFLFSANVSKPIYDILLSYRLGLKTKISIIIAGQITTEMTSIYGRLLQHTIKLFNFLNSPLSNAFLIESKVDYDISPKNRDLEMFMSIQTDINNGNHPVMFTDNNGFEYTRRMINISRRIESNVYPMTTMTFLQDHKSRMTVITDHAQGVTALQEGHLALMLDRRILFNDGRGTHEGLADNIATYHRHFIVLENLVDLTYKHSKTISNAEVELPSFLAIHLSNSLDSAFDIFFVDKKYSDLPYYVVLPLIKNAFPCDVSVITSRVIVNKASLKVYAPSMGLLVLHRQSFSCRIRNAGALRCTTDSSFLLEKIYRTMKGAYQTNLGGTNNGVLVKSLTLQNFPPMELMTIKVFY